MLTLNQRIIRVLAAQTGIAPCCIQPEHTLATDLQCDSLDCIEVMMALEEEFGIKIDQDEGEKLQTVQQVLDYVTGVCNAEQSSAPCITHHHACDCREAKIKTLMEVSLSAILELDGIKNAETPLSQKEKNRLMELVETGHDALQALGMKYTEDDAGENDLERAIPLGGMCTAGQA
jgi:acyl carrier protein